MIGKSLQVLGDSHSAFFLNHGQMYESHEGSANEGTPYQMLSVR